MLPLPGKCPLCGGDVIVTRIHCRGCDTSFEGRFTSGRLFQLAPEQLQFIETFVRYEGKITHMENEMKISYPTIRNRLHDIIRALGYEPGGEEPGGLSEEARLGILEELDQGKISLEQAMSLLRESEG